MNEALGRGNSSIFLLGAGQGVDLGREDEVVLREPADGVGPDLDGDVAVADEVEVGVVPLLLGQGGDLVEEVDRRP